MCNGRRITPKEVVTLVEAVLEEFNVLAFVIEQNGKKHPYVKFVINGVPVKYSLPSSPSDKRGLLATRTLLRRVCRQHTGVEGGSIR